jgi:hypothetical protein
MTGHECAIDGQVYKLMTGNVWKYYKIRSRKNERHAELRQRVTSNVDEKRSRNFFFSITLLKLDKAGPSWTMLH